MDEHGWTHEFLWKSVALTVSCIDHVIMYWSCGMSQATSQASLSTALAPFHEIPTQVLIRSIFKRCTRHCPFQAMSAVPDWGLWGPPSDPIDTVDDLPMKMPDLPWIMMLNWQGLTNMTNMTSEYGDLSNRNWQWWSLSPIYSGFKHVQMDCIHGMKIKVSSRTSQTVACPKWDDYP